VVLVNSASHRQMALVVDSSFMVLFPRGIRSQAKNNPALGRAKLDAALVSRRGCGT
jgi:hypothetical protein